MWIRYPTKETAHLPGARHPACALLLLAVLLAGSTTLAADDECAAALVPLRVLSAAPAHVSYPTGDKSFAVLEAFPGGGALAAERISPFLLAHEWGAVTKTLDGRVAPDPGPPSLREKAATVGWHPHRGFDLLSYIKEGRGSHADSLGNVAVVRPGGVQYMRAGSGIEHAEGGGTPQGASKHGFQLWYARGTTAASRSFWGERPASVGRR